MTRGETKAVAFTLAYAATLFVIAGGFIGYELLTTGHLFF